jgi:hypothetical protein
MEDLSVNAPILIVGTMRSGSTLLRLMLDSHPAISVGPETNFLSAVAATKDIPNWKYGREWYGRLGWSERELDARLRSFYAGMFERHAASQGKRRWGDKTPAHTDHMRLGAQVFPDAVFLGIVRHPGGTATSLMQKFHYTWQAALAYWDATNATMVRDGAALGDRFAVCRYEDLVAEPEPVLRDLLAWLDEPWSDSVLEHQRVQRERGTPRLVDGDTNTREAVDSSRAERWGDEVDAGARTAMIEQVGPLAQFFGYDPEDPSRRAPLASAGSRFAWIATGSELAEHQRAWQDRIDLRPRAEVVSPDTSPEELAQRAVRAEATLARMRARRVVRVSDALLRLRRGRSVEDLRVAARILRRTHRAS